MTCPTVDTKTPKSSTAWSIFSRICFRTSPLWHDSPTVISCFHDLEKRPSLFVDCNVYEIYIYVYTTMLFTFTFFTTDSIDDPPTSKGNARFRVHCSWLKFSHPMMKSTSLQRCVRWWILGIPRVLAGWFPGDFLIFFGHTGTSHVFVPWKELDIGSSKWSSCIRPTDFGHLRWMWRSQKDVEDGELPLFQSGYLFSLFGDDYNIYSACLHVENPWFPARNMIYKWWLVHFQKMFTWLHIRSF